ncbi:MAG: flavin reductase family protein [Anaerolineaceae bacterium]|nr:flavin reductase family protein [Anaerolineaceae bacterium]
MKKSFGAKVMPMPAPVWVVGTYDVEGKANMMTAAWAGICCSKPASVYVSLRKATYSYGNIVQRGAYTINVPSLSYIKEADYVGIVSGRDVDKFSATGLTAVRSDLVDAPYVNEFPVVMECKLLHTIEIGLHTMFIGEIQDVKIDEAVLAADGRPEMEKLGLFVYSTDYYAVGKQAAKAFSIGKELS